MSELIDRRNVIDRLKKAEDVFRQNGAKLEANGIHYALELVESDIEIPTIEPCKDRPHGKWIYHEDWKNEGGCGYECSCCGRTYDYAMNFCGYCGLKMNTEGKE